MKKPIPLRVIFILNALMMFLPFVFCYAVASGKLNVGIPATTMAYTGIAYIMSFAILVTSILKKNIRLLRGVIAVNVLMALPAKAFIAIGVAIVSMALSFNSQVKNYFSSGSNVDNL